ncbi:YfhO family protein [Chitinophaga solisilvae]|uniref:YfhO family protein n=1 Tax=Chitinophaga solisilvae TaxID=1233460 RepID=UPI0013717D9F|nr:YfhO family protein [Chitinophaga solisilvae]
MQQSWQKSLLYHLGAVILFVSLALVFCSPVLEGRQLFQSDMMHVKGMEKEAVDYYKTTGNAPLWSNNMFGGMPTYVIYTGPTTNRVYWLNRISTLFLPNPADMLFVMMLGMYILLSVMDFKYWIRILGAVAYGFATFSIVSMEVGHITKVLSMAWLAPVLAGIILTYRGKLLTGGALTALAAALLVYNNHVQIAYYGLIMVAFLGLGTFLVAWREHRLPAFFKASLVLLFAGIIAVLPAMDNLLIMKEYTRYTMRGSQSELTLGNKKSGQQTSGLDVGYAFQWSYGPRETFTLLLPELAGGASSRQLPSGSHTYAALVKAGIPPEKAATWATQKSWPLYWAAQPNTAGPVYVGAIICFLFVLALLIVQHWYKWWLLGVTILAVILSWGANLPAVNNFIFYHLPLYNKFRSPTMILAIPQITFVFLACWALQTLLTTADRKIFLLEQLKKAFAVTAGLIIALAFLGAAVYTFSSPNDMFYAGSYQRILGSREAADSIMHALRKDRSALLIKDGIRALALVSLAFGLCWLLLKDKIKATVCVIALAVLSLADLYQVDKIYMSNDDFVAASLIDNYNAPTPADKQILQDKSLYYRVLNTTVSPFLDANTSYYHKSIGGQSPAKLWIYQDLIEHQLSRNNQAVFNMLNTKYFIVTDTVQKTPVARLNPDALGNAWFVKGIRWAPDANAEMRALDHFNPADTAVIDQRFKQQLGSFIPVRDSAARIILTHYDIHQLTYTSQNAADGFAVFSDIYYPAGWKAFIDGKETAIIRVNYALRGLKIPAGKHEITFIFHPDTYFLGQQISLATSWVLMVLVLAGFVAGAIWRK